eukprot:g35628.t1
MNRKIHSLLKSRSEAFKLSNSDLYRKSRKMRELVIHFRKLTGGHAPVCINGAEVEMVDSFKFLGVNITNNLSWSIHAVMRSDEHPTSDLYNGGKVIDDAAEDGLAEDTTLKNTCKYAME